MKVIVVGSSHGGFEAVQELLQDYPDAEFNGTKRAISFRFFLVGCSSISKVS